MKSKKYLILNFFLIVGFFSLVFYWSSQNIEFAEIFTSKVENKTKLKRDDNGFAHIYAKNITDAFFVLGYSHAKDRLFQIDVQRRIASGTLSEILGEKGLKSDILMRTLGIRLQAKKMEYNIELFKKYVDGVNFFVDEGNFIPPEYYALNIKFEKFTILDAASIMKFWSFSHANNWVQDLFFESLKGQISDEILEFLFNPPDFFEASILDEQDLDLKDKKSEKKGLKIDDIIKDEIRNEDTITTDFATIDLGISNKK